MAGHASHHRPRISFDPIDLTRLALSDARRQERREWPAAVERELAHDERRDGADMHELKMPKREP
jgi:hypothetical protein